MSELYVKLSLQEVCHSVGLESRQLLEIVEHGIVEPEGESPEHWLFDTHMLGRARRACRLHYDLELEWEAIGLVMDLLHEKERLQQENAMLQRQLRRFLADQD